MPGLRVAPGFQYPFHAQALEVGRHIGKLLSEVQSQPIAEIAFVGRQERAVDGFGVVSQSEAVMRITAILFATAG